VITQLYGRPPRLKEIDGSFKTRNFRVQPQAIMGSSIVEYFGKTVSRSSCSQTPGSARTSKEAIESCGEKCTNLCRVLKPNRLAMSPVMDNVSNWNWIVWIFLTLLIIMSGFINNLGYENWLAEPSH
jgi:hypothetical protein